MHKAGLLFGILFCSAVFSSSAIAHKLAPSLLKLTEQAEHNYDVFWKTPATTQAGRNLQPVLPNSCQPTTPSMQSKEGTGLVWRWTINCDKSLVGEQISVQGMAQSSTATLLTVAWQDGRKIQQLLNAGSADYTIPKRQSFWQVMAEYVWLGAEHIWAGMDHLLFVLALLLLVPTTRQLIWTITSFTVGHSLTLTLVVLGIVDYPVSLVEFAIAASILVLAVELVKTQLSQTQNSRWIPSHSWFVAMAFGLLHGMGFAGALREVGLPVGDIPQALLSFNMGIELGQIAFVGLILLIMHAARQSIPMFVRPAWWTTVYSIGSLSAFWCIERAAAVIS